MKKINKNNKFKLLLALCFSTPILTAPLILAACGTQSKNNSAIDKIDNKENNKSYSANDLVQQNNFANLFSAIPNRGGQFLI